MNKHTSNVINSIKSLFKDIGTNIFATFITSLVVAIATYLGVNIYVGILCFIIVFISLIAIIIYEKRKKHPYDGPEHHKDFKYKFIKKSIYFEYSVNHEHTYNTRHRVCALQDNINTFGGRYTWDASKVNMVCEEPPNTQITVHPKKDSYHTYSIYFNDRKYNTGDKYNVNINSTMFGKLKFPLFASTVINPTELLIIRIKLPIDALENNRIKLVTSSNPPEKEPPQTKEAKLNKRGEYIWRIPNPELWYEYSIEWNFKAAVLKEECPESSL